MSMNNQKTLIVVVALAVVIGGVAFFASDMPSDSDQASGTIVPAERYRGDQITASDVELGDESLSQLMQTDLFEKIVNDAFASLDSEFRQKEIEKTVSIDGNIELNCDAKRISQVLTSLLDNSLKAIQPKLGKIKVSASQLENRVTVSVHDNGCGIPKEELDKVFSKFYQVDMSNTREKGGVGLGLSICQKIIDAHDGKIWIESELDKETTVNFTLPRK